MSDRVTVAHAIWQANRASEIGRQNSGKRFERVGMKKAALHIACALYQSQEERAAFMKACGFDYS